MFRCGIPSLLFILLILGLIKSTYSAAIRHCEGSSNYQMNVNGTCRFVFNGLNHALSYSDAVQRCRANNEFLGPLELNVANFWFFTQQAFDCGSMHTSYDYDSATDSVLLDEQEVDPGGYVWENSSRPSASSPRIVASYSSTTDQLVFSPGRLDEVHLFLCVEDPCLGKSCNEGQTCSIITGICGYRCDDIPTTTAQPTTSDHTTTTSEQTTMQATTTDSVTTSDQTTTRATTTDSPTTPDQTTTQDTTTDSPTTPDQTTTEDTTTDSPTTPNQTTTQDMTDSPTTSDQTTTEDTTTDSPTTTNQTTTQDMTDSPTTSDQTTTQDTTTNSPTTPDQTTTQVMTHLPTTSDQATIVIAKTDSSITSDQETTLATTEQHSTHSELATTTDKPTASSKPTAATQTTTSSDEVKITSSGAESLAQGESSTRPTTSSQAPAGGDLEVWVIVLIVVLVVIVSAIVATFSWKCRRKAGTR